MRSFALSHQASGSATHLRRDCCPSLRHAPQCLAAYRGRAVPLCRPTVRRSSRPTWSLQMMASASSPLQPAHKLPEETRIDGPCWKRAAVLLGVGIVAVSLLTPSAAWAKACCEGAASTPSYSFPTAVKGLAEFILHFDKHLSAIIAEHGKATYAILFAIVFAETGFVLTPFLPGDSLLFAAGAFAALGSLNVWAVIGVFITAAIFGDALNYAIGKYAGAKAIERGLVNRGFVTKTEDFYRKYGGKTVVLARFVPIVRTFAPFVAGVGSMPYAEFGAYNVGGALLWTFLFVGAGFFLGNLPAVKHNFTLVILGIVAISVLPIIFEMIATRRKGASKGVDRDDLPKGPARWRPG